MDRSQRAQRGPASSRIGQCSRGQHDLCAWLALSPGLIGKDHLPLQCCCDERCDRGPAMDDIRLTEPPLRQPRRRAPSDHLLHQHPSVPRDPGLIKPRACNYYAESYFRCMSPESARAGKAVLEVSLDGRKFSTNQTPFLYYSVSNMTLNTTLAPSTGNHAVRVLLSGVGLLSG